MACYKVDVQEPIFMILTEIFKKTYRQSKVALFSHFT